MDIDILVPSEITEPLDKWSWSVIADEDNRIAHNWVGTWYRLGKTQEEYDNAPIPDIIKELLPYTQFLSKEQWLSFVEWHRKATQQIHLIMHTNRPAIPNQTQEERDIIFSETQSIKINRPIEVNLNLSIKKIVVGGVKIK